MRVQAQGSIEEPLSHGFGLTRFVSSQNAVQRRLAAFDKSGREEIESTMCCSRGDRDGLSVRGCRRHGQSRALQPVN